MNATTFATTTTRTDTTRTDAHRPAEMVPANYEYLASSYGYKVEDLQGFIDTVIEWDGGVAWDNAGRPEVSTCTHAKRGQCDHCGAHHRYQTILKYLPTGDFLSVGHTCATERFGNADFKHQIASGARRAELKAERNGRVAKALAVMTVETKAAYEWALTDGAREIAKDIAGKIAQYGPLTGKQSAFLVKLHTESMQVAEAVEAKDIAPCPTGRLVVQGVVKTTKWQENAYGGSLKMLVETDGGYRVWGSVPAAISVNRGDTVRFTATLEPKEDDVTFGFFTRPSKAEVIAVTTLVTVA